MTQRIKIPVEAQTSGAEDAIRRLDRTAEQAGSSVSGIASGAAAAAKSIDDAAAATERLARAQAILSRETGRPVSRGDTQTFLDNFERMRHGRGLGARRVRSFDNFENWYQGHQSSFTRPATAEQHRRMVISAGMQGTRDAAENGGPPASGGGGGGMGGMGAMAQRAGGSAFGFLKGGLALAGIGGIMAVAAQGLSKAAEEAIGIDTLKRRMGDLGVDFEGLRDRVRSTGDGLGVAFAESQRLANSFARERGAANLGDMRTVRTGIGFGRSYGMEPEQGVNFFGRMGRLGVANDDTSARKLGLTIADAIEKGGYTAKADEVLAAISNYTEQTARLTLSAPNVGAYSSYLTSLMATGQPGLDPSGAAALLASADGSVRRGGAMGEASLNLSLAALLQGNRGMDPVTAKALMEGGLFGTTNSVFGTNPDGTPTALGGWYGARGIRTPQLNDTTNFERMMPMLRQQYGNSPYLLDAIKNHFGLESLSQASALERMSPADLSASRSLVERSGVDFSKLSATGFQAVSSIANANTGGELRDAFVSVNGRSDVTGDERKRLAEALGESVRTGNTDALKQALVAVVGTKEQEQTEGQKTRESVAAVERAVTSVGSILLAPINIIRDGINMLAKVLAPREWDAKGYAERLAAQREEPQVNGHQEFVNMTDGGSQREATARTLYDQARTRNRARYEEARAASPNGRVNIASIVRPPDPALLTAKEPFGTFAGYNRQRYFSELGQYQDLQRVDQFYNRPDAANPGLGQNLDALGNMGALNAPGASRQSREDAAMSYFMGQGWTKNQAAGIVGNLTHESGMNPAISNQAGDSQAFGIAQWTAERRRALFRWAGTTSPTYAQQLAFIQHELETTEAAAAERLRGAGTVAQSAEAFTYFERAGTGPRGTGRFDPRNPRATHGWSSRVTHAARLAGEELPAGTTAGADGGGNMTVQFAPAIVTLQDTRGQVRGSTTLNPFPQSAAPAGQ